MRIAYVTNFCTHYTVKLYEMLGRRHDVDYYFFSEGREWYWQAEHSTRSGHFNFKYLPGFALGGTRFVPSLIWKLLAGRYDVFFKCINGKFALPVTYAVARLKGKPFILYTGIWHRLDTPLHRLVFPLTRYIYTHADAVVVYGEHVKRYLRREGVSGERIFVAPHAIDNAEYSRRIPAAARSRLLARLGLGGDRKIVLYLGRLEEGKGIRYLLEAFARIRDAKAVLVVAGRGSCMEELKDRAGKLGIADRCRFPGYVPTRESAVFYSVAYAYVLPSITTKSFREPWGLVVNEAFCQGVPVVATDAVGAAAGGLVRNGVNGIVVPEANVGALAAALVTLLASSRMRERMGGRARQIIRSWDRRAMLRGFLEAMEYVSGEART